jgi:hypothetical protein
LASNHSMGHSAHVELDQGPLQQPRCHHHGKWNEWPQWIFGWLDENLFLVISFAYWPVFFFIFVSLITLKFVCLLCSKYYINNVLKGTSRNIPKVFRGKIQNLLTCFFVNIYSRSRWGERHWLHSLELDGQLRVGAWLPVILIFMITCIFVRSTYHFYFDFLVFVFCQQGTIWNALRKLYGPSQAPYSQSLGQLLRSTHPEERICPRRNLRFGNRLLILKILFCIIPLSCVTDKFTKMKK